MSVQVLYATRATASGGRDGRVTTADGSLDLTMSTPTALGGTGAPGNNPGTALRRQLRRVLPGVDEFRRHPGWAPGA